jgi:2-hydroxychromene-2-carboxylate isomerase
LATRKIIAGLNSRAGVSIIPLTLKNCSVTAGSFSAAVSTRSRYACVSRIANGREPVTPGRPRSDRQNGAMDSPHAADLNFYFDPVCPFAWMTSKWVRMVAAQRDYRVDWRFISLRLLNANVDYATHFPEHYEDEHTAGLRLLRVFARLRSEQGREAVPPLYEALGARLFDTPRDGLSAAALGTAPLLEPLLREAGLPAELAAALDDASFDDEIRTETEEALALTGRDVGTPILHFQPPEGTAFFGPVISRLPSPNEAATLWDHVIALAAFPGFAEIKRSLRERPQLASFGIDAETVGKEEDWHGGSRRLKK